MQTRRTRDKHTDILSLRLYRQGAVASVPLVHSRTLAHTRLNDTHTAHTHAHTANTLDAHKRTHGMHTPQPYKYMSTLKTHIHANTHTQTHVCAHVHTHTRTLSV